MAPKRQRSEDRHLWSSAPTMQPATGAALGPASGTTRRLPVTIERGEVGAETGETIREAFLMAAAMIGPIGGATAVTATAAAATAVLATVESAATAEAATAEAAAAIATGARAVVSVGVSESDGLANDMYTGGLRPGAVVAEVWTGATTTSTGPRSVQATEVWTGLPESTSWIGATLVAMLAGRMSKSRGLRRFLVSTSLEVGDNDLILAGAVTTNTVAVW